jgi:hypothetical protein
MGCYNVPIVQVHLNAMIDRFTRHAMIVKYTRDAAVIHGVIWLLNE